ncbi:MAG TPA: sulfur carrier protein ThiS [Anaerolineae bacterium]|jgi:thiamine biosynthesis protein ThiS|nr:sulfur carrier protein ThiS [Anaerolineae bacterium]
MIRVNNKWDVDWREGMTVDDVLAACNFSHRHVVVSVNGELVPLEKHATRPVADGDQVQAVHIIGGG